MPHFAHCLHCPEPRFFHLIQVIVYKVFHLLLRAITIVRGVPVTALGNEGLETPLPDAVGPVPFLEHVAILLAPKLLAAGIAVVRLEHSLGGELAPLPR